MTFAMATVLVVVAVAVVLFATELVPFDVTALGIVAALLLTGVLTPAQALAGFASEATVAVAALVVLTAALERTGVLNALAEALERHAERHLAATLGAGLVLTGAASAFVNNTAVVALLIPLVLRLASRLRLSPSHLLMPLSFAAIFGGVCTLIGTSTNLLVSAMARDRGLAPLGMFELAPVGLAFAAVGLAWAAFAVPRLVPPRRGPGDLTGRFALATYLTDVRLGDGFPREGGAPRGATLLEDLDVDVLDVFRDGVALSAPEDIALQRGDVLRVRGGRDEIARLLARDDLHVGPARTWTDEEVAQPRDVLVEAVLAPDTGPVGATVDETDLPQRHGARLLAVRSHGRLHREGLGSLRLRGGDSVLLRLDRAGLEGLRADRAFVVVSEVRTPRDRADRAPVAVATLAAAVLVAALTPVPIVATALAGVCIVLVARCLSVDEMYEAIPWKVVVLLAGVIPLGTAMHESGAAHVLGASAVTVLRDAPPRLVVAAFFLLAVLLTNVMSNVAAAALLVPIALDAAASLGLDARPVLMAVTYGASLSFLTPIGYQTNTLIFGPGEYRYGDFARAGAPLTLLCTLLAAWLIPLAWPP